MPDEFPTHCPMCGRTISTNLATCPDCGERLDSDREPVQTEAVRAVDFRAPLNLLNSNNLAP